MSGRRLTVGGISPRYSEVRFCSFSTPATLNLDGELLARYPEGYRHLAYSLVRAGQKVRTDVPGLDGPALDAVYARGAAWLAGKPLEMSA